MMKPKSPIQLFRHFSLTILVIILSLFTTANHSPANAQLCVCCGCLSCIRVVAECAISSCACQELAETPQTLLHIYDEFEKHEEWLIEEVWQDHLLPAMLMMANQLSAVAMQQMLVVGSFFDAKHQLESQRLLQDLQAQAHKDYQPSAGMCRFGTNTRSLAHADGNIVINQVALAARNTQRTLMASGAVGTGGALDDSRSRLAQFRNTYCNPKDFGNALDLLCTGGDVARRNKDINYTNNVQDQYTLFLNFSDTETTLEEEDVLALSANLYGNRLLPPIPEIHIADKSGNLVKNGSNAYMDTRALAAKRSVAFNSFAAQTAEKSQGGAEVVPYLTEILKEMGLTEGDVGAILKGNPSYYAQMEILTKRLYQSPNFYADLYDKPVNVDRKDTAMQAIGLMQKRDMYRSQLRSEANMAVWLETMVQDLQEYQTNETTGLKEDQIILNLGL